MFRYFFSIEDDYSPPLLCALFSEESFQFSASPCLPPLAIRPAENFNLKPEN
jgi:hypothetical protein